MTDQLPTPAELAAIRQHQQTIERTLDNLLAAYRKVTSDGEVPHEVDLLLFAGALPETVETHSMGALLACAIARLAQGREHAAHQHNQPEDRTVSTDETRPYRVGWGRLPRMIGEYRRLLPLIARGVQGDGQRVKRRRWWPKIRRDLRTIVTLHPKYLLHRPWQSEAEGQRFARRGFTPEAARRKMLADLEHELLTGQPSRYQRYRRWRSRRWDRQNLPHRAGQSS